MRDVIAIFVVMAGVFGALFGLILGMSFMLVTYTCNGYETATGKETKMVSLDCYIKDEGKWYVWEEYKYRFVTKGEM
jgi:hypothetical protein